MASDEPKGLHMSLDQLIAQQSSEQKKKVVRPQGQPRQFHQNQKHQNQRPSQPFRPGQTLGKGKQSEQPRFQQQQSFPNQQFNQPFMGPSPGMQQQVCHSTGW